MNPSNAGRQLAEDNERSAVDRRYKDLSAMAIKYWAKNGLRGENRFDERKYWTYGCHCLFLGDRPMSTLGGGTPVDGLDRKCKVYKDCLRCVRKTHGPGCIAELRKYQWMWSSEKDRLSSTNSKGSCPRELFECDRRFVEDLFENRASFDEQFHTFWSPNGFDNRDPNNCPSGSNTPSPHECCGGGDRPYNWFSLRIRNYNNQVHLKLIVTD